MCPRVRCSARRVCRAPLVTRRRGSNATSIASGRSPFRLQHSSFLLKRSLIVTIAAALDFHGRGGTSVLLRHGCRHSAPLVEVGGGRAYVVLCDVRPTSALVTIIDEAIFPLPLRLSLRRVRHVGGVHQVPDRLHQWQQYQDASALGPIRRLPAPSSFLGPRHNGAALHT